MHPALIDLSDAKPLSHGRDQQIFQHPDHPDRLIKTLKPDRPTKRIKRYASWRYRHLRGWHRDISEYIAMLARNGRHCDRLPRFFGICDTSHGPGYCVEKMTAPDGSLAPTLAQFIARPDQTAAMLNAVRTDLHALFDTLVTDRIDFHDSHGGNIVITGADNPRLMIIDGIGSATLIPLTQFSDRAFHRMTRQARQKLVGTVDAAIARCR